MHKLRLVSGYNYNAKVLHYHARFTFFYLSCHFFCAYSNKHTRISNFEDFPTQNPISGILGDFRE
jgi:hypothetical protein